MPPPPAADLLAWYDRHRRVLPWRVAPADPYRVWLSEVMLQQTTVAAVGPRYARFLARFPDVGALAAAPVDAVLEEWAGLGYYARARNLHEAARAVVAAGAFPDTEAGLRALPGVGAYTAAAIAAFAFGRASLPVDGNVERVAARVFAFEGALPAGRGALAAMARTLLDDPAARARPGDFPQALFDLGATICTARAPACALCPWRSACAGLARGIAAALPRKPAQAERAIRFGTHFRVTDSAGQILVRRRPSKGLLGGMLELPGTPWRAAPWSTDEALTLAPLAGGEWHAVAGVARHAFTHLALEMSLFARHVPLLDPPEGMEARSLATVGAALPTAMRKLLELGRQAAN